MTIAAPQTAPISISIAADPLDRRRAVPARPVRVPALTRRGLFLLGLGIVMLLVRTVIGIAIVASFAVAAVRAVTRRIRTLRR